MRYISIDIETTGLDYKNDLILEFSAIIEDTELNLPIEQLPILNIKFYYENIIGSPYALELNKNLINYIKNNKDKCIEYKYDDETFNNKLIKFLLDNNFNLNEKINIAGKNFSNFDKLFLINKFNIFQQIILSHRVLDPAILYLDLKLDSTLPDLSTCCERANIKINNLHTATEDALLIIKLIRAYYDKYNNK